MRVRGAAQGAWLTYDMPPLDQTDEDLALELMLAPGDAVNLLVRCDAIEVGLHVPARSAQLAYLDPPFGVGMAFGARSPDATGGARWRAEGTVAYSDRWPSIDAYLAWLEPRIAAVRDCLATDATMWLHLDHRAVHEARGSATESSDRRPSWARSSGLPATGRAGRAAAPG